MRVVADTNIYISALNFGGFSDEVVSLALAGAIELYISEPILEEIQGVLLRKFRWSEDRARRAACNIRRTAALVTPQETLQVILEDEPDNRILECALASDAEVIVSGDSHLLRLKRFRGIAVLNPREFLAAYWQDESPE